MKGMLAEKIRHWNTTMKFNIAFLFSFLFLMITTKTFSCEQYNNADIRYITKSGMISNLNKNNQQPFKIKDTLGMVYYGEATNNAIMYIDSEGNLYSNTSVIASGITSFTITNGTVYAVNNRDTLIRLISSAGV
jgi:predicted lipase